MAPDWHVAGLTDSLAETADGLASRLFAAAQSLERRFDESYAELGLNLSRAQVLACIARHGSQGCSQTDLATTLDLSESNICTLIERMRNDGWLIRMRSDVDRRKSIVVLSPRGAEVIKDLLQRRRACTADYAERLGVEQMNSLNELLDILQDSLKNRPAQVAGSVHSSASESLRRAS